MLGLGVPHLLILFLIVLLIFGAGKLPEVGKSLGKAIKEFKNSISQADPEKPKDNNDEHKSA
jgi:sec-independent protein translocase protein TatA